MVGRLRNGKKYSDGSDNESEKSNNGSEGSVEEENLNLSNKSRSSASPHLELRNKFKDQFQELEFEDNESEDYKARRRQAAKRLSSKNRSRSTSRTRTEFSEERSFKVNASPKLRKKQDQIKLSTKSSSSCSKLISFLFLIALLGSAGYFGYDYYKKNFKTPTIDEVLLKYQNNLHGPTNVTIKAAVEKSQKKDQNKPVVLLLYGDNQNKIREFYLELGRSIESRSNLNETIFEINNLVDNHELIANKLKNNRIALFDGLEKLKGENFMELYGFVDEGDAVVRKCLIIISLYDKVININLNNINEAKNIFEMDENIRGKLRKLWIDIDKNNLEAFLNRILSFVAFVY